MPLPRILTINREELKAHPLSELESNYDLVLVANTVDTTTQPPTVCIPYKLKWLSEKSSVQTKEEHFRKRSDFKRWEESVRQAENAGCVFFKIDLNEESFKIFYDLYENTVAQKDRGSMLLSSDWLKMHHEKGDAVFAYFGTVDQKVVGGMIGFVDSIENQYHVSFLAQERVLPGLTAGLQNLLLEDVISSKAAGIFYGRDRNLYGIIASAGLVYNKSKFGLTPFADRNEPEYQPFLLTNPNQEDILFFCASKNTNLLDLLIISDNPDESGQKYMSGNVKNVTIISSHEFISKSREAIKSLV